MSKMMTGSICLTDIPKEKITVSEKNGKKYLNIVIWINDEPDKYGNDASIQVSQLKEERESKQKAVYIGNAKSQNKQAAPSNYPTSPQPGYSDNDLPF
jgi:ACT domain-containing protein